MTVMFTGMCHEAKIDRAAESSDGMVGGRVARTPATSVVVAGYSLRIDPEIKYAQGVNVPTGIVGSKNYVAIGELTDETILDGDILTCTGPPNAIYLNVEFLVRSATLQADEAGNASHVYFELDRVTKEG